MNLVCVLASPHGLKGNTFHLVESVLTGARRLGAQTRIALIEGSEVLPCRGCDNCHRTGECPQDDGFDEIRQAVEEADGLILATPNYIANVSAQMKAFMDRCAADIHCLSFAGKYGISVVTSGAGSDEEVTGYLSRFLMMTGIRPVGSVHAPMAAMPHGEFTAEVRERAEALGEELVKAWREGRVDPDVEHEMAAFRERMRQLVVWKRDEWPYEYGYWQERHGTA